MTDGAAPVAMTWTLSEAARECGVHPDTVKRRRRELEAAGAAKDEKGVWRVTYAQLVEVGFRPGQPTPPEEQTPAGAVPQGTDAVHPVPAPVHPDAALVQRIAELEATVAVERARREAAEALAAERASSLDRMDRALLMLEAARPAAPVPQVRQPVEPFTERVKGLFGRH